MTNNELIVTAKQCMKDLWEVNQGRLLEHEQTAYNCLRLFCERLGNGVETTTSIPNKWFITGRRDIEGNRDDASVDYMVNISGRSGNDLLNEYRESGGYHGNDGRWFNQWVIYKGYCREVGGNEMEVVFA